MESRIQLSIKSVEAVVTLLREVCSDPKNFESDASLLSSLLSQGRLAKYENPNRGIKGMALNTFKSAADEIRGGFLGVDKLRKEAAAAVERMSVDLDPESTVSQAAKKRAIKELNLRVMQLQASNLVLLRTISENLRNLKDISNAASPANRKRLIDDCEARIHAALLSNAPPYDSVEFATLKLERT